MIDARLLGRYGSPRLSTPLCLIYLRFCPERSLEKEKLRCRVPPDDFGRAAECFITVLRFSFQGGCPDQSISRVRKQHGRQRRVEGPRGLFPFEAKRRNRPTATTTTVVAPRPSVPGVCTARNTSARTPLAGKLGSSLVTMPLASQECFLSPPTSSSVALLSPPPCVVYSVDCT